MIHQTVKQERVLNKPSGRQAAAESTASSSRNAYVDPKPYLTILSFLGSLSAPTIASEKYTANLQEVKGALFDRDYDRAFGSRSKPDWLRAYVARWVPGRALGYRAMLGDVDEEDGGCAVKVVGKLFEPLEGEQRLPLTKVLGEEEEDEKEVAEGDEESGSEDELNDAVATLDLSSPPSPSTGNEAPEFVPSRTINVLCYGSGPGSEIIALAAIARERGTPAKVHVQAVDSGNWGPVLSEMASGINTHWNVPVNRFQVDFVKQDILTSHQQETPIDIPRANLITLLYTTHELLTASRSATIAFLSNLTAKAKPGTLLMIVESAGSFSAMPVGQSEKTFPLEFLLDLVLAGGKDGGPGSRGEWEVVKKSESRWFRVPEGVGKGYPVKLENMRYVLFSFYASACVIQG